MSKLYEEFSGSFPTAKTFIEKSFENIILDYNDYYGTNLKSFRYKDEEELNEIFTDMYDNIVDYTYVVDFDLGRVVFPQY